MCNVNILHLIEGAKQAKELTVIIDVFRAFSFKNRIQNSVLVGERHGKKCGGFDYGNSLSTIPKEDELCAEYIKSLLEGWEFEDFEQRLNSLKTNGGAHFFDKDRQDIYLEADFYMCVKPNIFPFVIRIEKDEIGFIANKENVLTETAED